MQAVVIGCGQMGRNHKRILTGMGYEVATVDPAGGDYLGITDYIWSNRRPAMAVVATPPTFLAPCATRMVEWGVPTLVEKPMATDSDEGRALVELAQTNGVRLAVGYVERFNPAVDTLRDNLTMVGTVRHVEARRMSMRPDRPLGCVAFDLASHEIDVLGHLFGIDEIAAHRTEDLYTATCALHGGATATVTASWHSPAKVRTLTVWGDRAVLAIDYQAQEITYASERTTARLTVTKDEPLRRELESFVAGKEIATGSDGLRVIETLEQEAAWSGQLSPSR